LPGNRSLFNPLTINAKTQEMTMTINDVLILITGLLTLFCPPVMMPVYAAVTGHFPDTGQRLIAIRLCIWISAILIGVVWGGQLILRMLGLTLGALTLTGGFVLCTMSIPMMRGTHANDENNGAAKLEYPKWANYIAVPLIFPLSIGSAIVSLIISTSCRFHTIADLCVISAVCALLGIVIGVTYASSASWCRKLGDVAISVVERLSGIVLTAIAFQMVAQGLKDLLPGLASKA
jgi:multiple antibiotic resistance protein